jgi:hypothetical protein
MDYFEIIFERKKAGGEGGLTTRRAQGERGLFLFCGPSLFIFGDRDNLAMGLIRVLMRKTLNVFWKVLFYFRVVWHFIPPLPCLRF